jgi:DNA processing protein
MEPFYEIALTQVKGIGPLLAKNLLAHFGTAKAVFTAGKKSLMTVGGVGERVAAAILDTDVLRKAEKEQEFVKKHRITTLLWGDVTYPRRLADCPDAPILLYYRGNTCLNSKRVVSMVGTRSATRYGKAICEELAEALKPYDVLVVSGLAHGIDSFAHHASIQNGIPTIGVLGHGLDRMYPAAHRDLAGAMVSGGGGLLTEYPSGSNPDRHHFPQRNRIIAGLADVTIVVEAALKGGALITAEIANSYNRDVCAFPGNTRQENSAGCNYLIKTHRAHLITGINDLVYLMDWVPEKAEPDRRQGRIPFDLSAPEQKIFSIVKENNRIGLDTLALKVGIPQSKLAITLLEMEMKGMLIALPGKIYCVE